MVSSQLHLSREANMNTPKAILIGFALVAAAVFVTNTINPAIASRDCATTNDLQKAVHELRGYIVAYGH